MILSSDPSLFANVRRLLGSDPRFIDTGVELHCDGSAAPLTNIFPVETASVSWDNWDDSKPDLPDPRTSSVLILESRSPEWIAEVGRALAEGLDASVWVVDSADTIWPADGVDPAQLVLD